MRSVLMRSNSYMQNHLVVVVLPFLSSLSSSGRPLLFCSIALSSFRYNWSSRFFSSGGVDPNEITSLWYWGRGSNKKLPSSSLVDSAPPLFIPDYTATPTRIGTFHSVGPLAVSKSHTLFVANGKLHSFGNNQYSQLGREGDENAIGEVQLEDVCAVACGPHHSAAVTEAGELYTCGWGGSFWSGCGGLGYPGRENVATPTLVNSLSSHRVTNVACGSQHTVALTSEGVVLSSGQGEFGKLGRGHNGDQTEFMEIEHLSNLQQTENFKIVKIDCGAAFSAALTDNGLVFVWGRNDYGQLGLEDSLGDVYSSEIYPRQLRRFELEQIEIVDISCGDNHMLALSAQGIVYFWGARTWLTPRAVTMDPSYANNPMKERVAQVATGGAAGRGGVYHHYCMALTENGTLYSWGKVQSRCLAREPQQDANEPRPIDPAKLNGGKVLSIACGGDRVLATTV